MTSTTQFILLAFVFCIAFIAIVYTLITIVTRRQHENALKKRTQDEAIEIANVRRLHTLYPDLPYREAKEMEREDCDVETQRLWHEKYQHDLDAYAKVVRKSQNKTKS